jgi:hypothetical protein
MALSPEALGEAIGRDRAAELQREHRQHRALLGGAERDGPAVEARLDWP